MNATTRSITLAELLPELVSGELASLSVTGLTQDSRNVAKGDLFVARAGLVADGRAYIADALKAGASAVLCQGGDTEVTEFLKNGQEVPIEAPIIVWQEDSLPLGVIADRFFDSPSKKLRVVGITGTNGKTSSAHFLVQALEHLGVKTAIMGTIGNGFLSSMSTATHTTADAIEVHRQMAEFLEQQADAVVMEVSSHALDQGRVRAVDFDLVCYTNLSRDHLDYHQTMDAYAQAKARLFEEYDAPLQILNADDQYASLLLSTPKQGTRRLGFSIERKSDLSLLKLDQQNTGMLLEIDLSGDQIAVQLPLLGRFNVQNLLLVAGSLHSFGYKATEIQSALVKLKPVDGRMQIVEQADGPAVIVDYAHTPDALEKALDACREHTRAGDLHLLFGCGGDRDSGKRRLMAEVAEQRADELWVTSDNPRSESPESIIQEILEGLARPQDATVQPDRRAAIHSVISSAKQLDLVLIAGKGHETYQEIQGVRYPFSDVEVARSALAERCIA